MSHPLYPQQDLWGHARTPYAVYCHFGHGLVYLTKEEYDTQMDRSDEMWMCPICRHEASWLDDNYTQVHDWDRPAS